MKYRIGIASMVLLGAFPHASNAAPSPAHLRAAGGPGNVPEVKTAVSISLNGTSIVDIYCAGSKKKWPGPPGVSGKISVSVPAGSAPFIAGDNAPKPVNQWKQNPKPLPARPTSVAYACENSRNLSAGTYPFSWGAKWTPNPAPCWSAPAFSANISGGIVVWNPDGMGGTIYIPKLKSTTVNVAPDHKARKDKGRSRIEIGAGEQVDLVVENVPTPTNVDWDRSGDVGGIHEELHGLANQCRAKKPGGATGSGIVTAAVTTDWGNFQVGKTFSVLRPTEIKTRRKQKLPYPIGTMGAGMQLYFQIKPTNVSFAYIWIREKGGAMTAEGAPHNVSGFYSYLLSVRGAHYLDHVPAWGWSSPNESDNEVDYDTARSTSSLWPPPTGIDRGGTFNWEIPVLWEIDKVADGDLLETLIQDFSLAGNGTLTITKKQAHITRGINQTDGN